MNSRYRWAQSGDINAFFGLVLDNVAVLILMVSLLHATFDFPERFALRHMITGTALGVLIGDLLFFFLALRLAKQTGNTQVTAMPLGLDTPSTFGMALFVLGPAFVAGKQLGMDEDAAAYYAWEIGICSMFISGLFKMVCALGSGWVRRVVPRAGLLGSLAAIALVLISFFPLLEILRVPMVGLVSLAIILTSLVGRVPLPFKLPGTVGAFIVAGSMYGLMVLMSDQIKAPGESQFNPADGLLPTEWMEALKCGWFNRMQDTFNYLPLIIPFALATVVGGIDCTESAIAAGDNYDTRTVIGVEAFATLVASFCGAVIQTTPYIGHPAYKAMGGRAAYTLVTAIFMGIMGIVGLFGYFYQFIPAVAVFPILVFVGVEITAQSFLATPRRHYTAVAIACVPALAALAVNFMDQIWFPILDQGKLPAFAANAELASKVATAKLLSHGFILTSIFWASALAMAIDRKLVQSAYYYIAAAVCTLFGLIHSPLENSPIRLPFAIPGVPDSLVLPADVRGQMLSWFAGYVIVAVLLLLWALYLKRSGQTEPDGHAELEHV